MIRYCLCFLLLALFSATPVHAEKASFSQWLNSFYPRAVKQGITPDTWQKAFAGVNEPDPVVLKKAAYQPEFTTKIWDYLDGRINRKSVASGLVMAAVYRQTLQDVEKRFGVDSSIILAIWSMETSYGRALLHTSRLHYVPRALATLAYGDKRRRKFAEKQLVAALKILQAGDVDIENFTGSWAGAMGHTQFIPTSYIAYGVDMDGDHRRDIWHSVADALATAANLLKKNGWRSGKPWGFEVRVPEQMTTLQGKTKTIGQWQKLGFCRPDGAEFSHLTERAELKMIAGDHGPGFLVLRNFFVIKRYNNSDFYALAVGLLADRLSGKAGMVQPWPRPPGALNAEEKFRLQELLKKNGWYQGEIDGHPGPATAQAIKQFQHQQGSLEDGKPTREILHALEDL